MTEMAGRVVMDASAIGALLFREPEAEELEERIRGVQWVVPLLADYEVSSIFLKKIRSYPALRGHLEIGYQIYFDSDIDRVDVPVNRVVSLAEKNDLTVYDATYLWLAWELGLELITLDEKLRAVSR